MILDRQYKPTNDELTYHYCGAEAFAQIVRTRTMWHTAFTALNDATERTWGFTQFQDAADKLRKICGTDFIDRISEIVRLTQDHSVAMISSYSLNGDLLSQWRAYADDGRGVAIGFSPQELEMPANALRVLYDRAAQRKEITNNILHVFEVEKKQFGFKYDERFREHWFHFGLDFCSYKHPAFAVERRRNTCGVLRLLEALASDIPARPIPCAPSCRSRLRYQQADVWLMELRGGAERSGGIDDFGDTNQKQQA